MKQASRASHLGNLLRVPAAAGLAIFGLSLAPSLILSVSQPALAQLPPVNMGKFVHQPGDNQYSSATQQDRHGGGNGYQVINPSPQQVQGPSGWTRTYKQKPDISLEPIVCDEPIAQAGFPPLPDSLDLPGLRGASFGSAGMGGSRGGGYGGGYGNGGSAPGMGGPGIPENHSGYHQYQPGAFKQGNKTGKGAELYSSHDGASSPPSGGGGGGGYSNAQGQLSRMGKEPTLSDRGNPDAAPEAPQAVQVNQATTQDLSLPDDQQNGGNKRKSQSQAGRTLKRMGRQMTRQITRPLYSMPIRMPNFSGGK
ncbi:MAG: hypothetical protein JST01_12140 [Cyanobacteria bacterium SZAS TMP-1]|nr:hypothetical protein [Cyanobacteria bacterium SZAS TMP-1]